MSNKYRVYTLRNPMPWKTYYRNDVAWSSPEEALIYAATKRAKRLGKKTVKIEVIKEE